MRRYIFAFGLVLTACLCGAATASAAEKSAHEPKYKATVHGPEGKEEEKEFDLRNEEHARALSDSLHKGEVSELRLNVTPDIFGLSADLGIWTLVVFVVLVLVLRKVAWKPMLEGLQKREEMIRAAVDEAKKAREETERVRAEFRAEMAKAYEKIPQMMDEARRAAQRMSEEMRTKAQAETQADRQRLRREIETARDQALQDIWSQAANLATRISAKVIRRELNADDHRRLVDEALTELAQANVGWKDRNLI